MQDTENPYDELSLDYDLLIEMPQMHPKERTEPVCFTTLFFNRGRVPASKHIWEMAQIDAFWLLHVFRFGSCEVNSACRLFFYGLIHKEADDPDPYGEAAIALTDKGIGSVFNSLNDNRIRDSLFPFMRDFTGLESLHTESAVFFHKEQESRRLNYCRTEAVIRREYETLLKLPDLPPNKSSQRQSSGAIQ